MLKGEALEAMKAAPSVGFFATWMAGVDWNATAAFLACVYTAWLIGEKAWKSWKAWRGRKR